MSRPKVGAPDRTVFVEAIPIMSLGSAIIA
jgi:hypothetical protein